MTMAGRCQVGDILGVMDGDVAEIGATIAEVAIRMVDRLLSAGGELATLVTGQDAADGLVADVRRHLRRVHPGVELVVHDGGQPLWPLIVGVE
jgi:dihydroxyacetone kinase-like predicted kinase